MMNRKAASGQNLNIGASIPRQFTGVTVTWNGTKETVAQHAQDALDYVAELCYGNRASGNGNIESAASPVVSYADQIGKPMFIAVETTDINASGDPAKISFEQLQPQQHDPDGKHEPALLSRHWSVGEHHLLLLRNCGRSERES